MGAILILIHWIYTEDKVVNKIDWKCPALVGEVDNKYI